MRSWWIRGLLPVEPLHLKPQGTGPVPEHDPVPEIVEGQLLVRAVSDVTTIGLALRIRVHAVNDRPYGEAAAPGTQAPSTRHPVAAR